MERLPELLATHQDWLKERILGYAKQFGYSKYTASLEGAWQALVGGISAALTLASQTFSGIPELDPDQDLSQDPMAQFALVEAQRHRERGVDLGMFLSFLAYIRQAYLDLLLEEGIDSATREKFRRFVERCFDRFSIGVSVEWAAQSERVQLGDMQAAQRWLVAEKNKYLTLFEGLPHPALMLDPGLGLDSLNQAALALLDKDLPAGVGCYRPLRDHLLEHREPAPGASQPARPALQKILPWLASSVREFAASGRAQDTLLVSRRQGREARQYQVSLRRLPDESNQYAGMVVVLQDVTEREQATRDLKDAEERFGKAFLASPAGMALSTLEEGRFLAINQAFADITGLAVEGILGRTALELGLWRDPGSRQEVVQSINQGQKINNRHTRFKDRKGRKRTVLWSAEVLHVQDQPRLLTVMVDLTERQEAADQLQKERDLLKAILDTGPVGITVSDAAGRVSFFNPSALEIMGWGEEERAHSEGLRVPWLDWGLRSGDSQSEAAQTPVLAENQVLRKQLHTLGLPSGEQRVLSINVVQLHAQEDLAGGLVSIFEDVSQRMLTEQIRANLEKNRLVQSECYAQLIHCQEEGDLLTQICRVIVKLGNYALAWVGQTLEDAAKTVKPLAWYGQHADYAKEIQGQVRQGGV